MSSVMKKRVLMTGDEAAMLDGVTDSIAPLSIRAKKRSRKPRSH